MKVEEIRSALDGVSPETLADTLAIVFAEGKAPSQAVAGMNKPELANFAQAIIYLKKNYDFDELEHFTTEADLVYVQAGDRRVLLTDRMNTSPDNEPKSSSPSLGLGDTAPATDGGRFSNLEI